MTRLAVLAIVAVALISCEIPPTEPEAVASPTPERAGLGVSADEVVGAFVTTGDFSFGDTSVMGSNADGKLEREFVTRGEFWQGGVLLIQIDLFGPGHDIDFVAMTLSYRYAERNTKLQTKFDRYVDLLVTTVGAHRWAGVGEWVTQAISAALAGEDEVRTEQSGLSIFVERFEEVGKVVININPQGP